MVTGPSLTIEPDSHTIKGLIDAHVEKTKPEEIRVTFVKGARRIYRRVIIPRKALVGERQDRRRRADAIAQVSTTLCVKPADIASVMVPILRRAQSQGAAIAPFHSLSVREQTRLKVAKRISGVTWAHIRASLGGASSGLACREVLRTDLLAAGAESAAQVTADATGAYLISPRAAVQALLDQLVAEDNFDERPVHVCTAVHAGGAPARGGADAMVQVDHGPGLRAVELTVDGVADAPLGYNPAAGTPPRAGPGRQPMVVDTAAAAAAAVAEGAGAARAAAAGGARAAGAAAAGGARAAGAAAAGGAAAGGAAAVGAAAGGAAAGEAAAGAAVAAAGAAAVATAVVAAAAVTAAGAVAAAAGRAAPGARATAGDAVAGTATPDAASPTAASAESNGGLTSGCPPKPPVQLLFVPARPRTRRAVERAHSVHGMAVPP
ncbi:hypothetical protein I4F81_002896 [Pyropia yezoensis]|uniref:Uncharacterized protein n=1 Tax=Pyropia yezoensis TaxID=2788 RepID=A0ACC3BS10_PYRYE|nr:hypothetical protein I4F81_002896 [Neopyropia yezoensis]